MEARVRRKQKTAAEFQREEAEGGLLTVEMLDARGACDPVRRQMDLARHLGLKRVQKRHGLTLPGWAEVRHCVNLLDFSATVEDLGTGAMWLDEDRAAWALAEVLETRALLAIRLSGRLEPLSPRDAELIDLLRGIGRPLSWGSSLFSRDYHFTPCAMRAWLAIALSTWDQLEPLPDRSGVQPDRVALRFTGRGVSDAVRATFLRGWMDYKAPKPAQEAAVG